MEPCTSGRNQINLKTQPLQSRHYRTFHTHLTPHRHVLSINKNQSRPSLALICRSIVEKGHDATATIEQQQQEQQEEQPTNPLEGFSYTSPDGRWHVRQLNKQSPEEVRRIVALQTEGFHVRNPIPFIDSTLKTFFQAEVLSEMQKKIRFNPVDRFVSLVLESADGKYSGVMAVVEVSFIDEKEILNSLEPGTEAFVYIASMAVDPICRRQGAATALLLAAEQVAALWEEKQTLLHVYQDNTAAIETYKYNSYEVIYQDAPWLAKVAVRPRFLMRKKFGDNNDGVKEE